MLCQGTQHVPVQIHPASPSHIQHQHSQTTNASLQGRARAEAVAQTLGARNIPKNRGLDTPQHAEEPEQGTGSTGAAPLLQRTWLSKVRSQENAGPKFFILFSQFLSQEILGRNPLDLGRSQRSVSHAGTHGGKTTSGHQSQLLYRSGQP